MYHDFILWKRKKLFKTCNMLKGSMVFEVMQPFLCIEQYIRILLINITFYCINHVPSFIIAMPINLKMLFSIVKYFSTKR